MNVKKTECKRQTDISDIGGLTKSLLNDEEFVIRVPSEFDIWYVSNRREEIIRILSQAYFELTDEKIPIYGVKAKTMKEYTTTEKDAKKG